MSKLHSLLDRYDTVLLDMDGVVTSESVYWNAAALTVYELLNSKLYFGDKDIDPVRLTAQALDLRKEIFLDDAVIKMVKSRGVNNNWDLAWLVAGGALVLKTQDYQAIYDWLCTLPDTAAGLYAALSEALCKKAGMTKEEATHPNGFWLTVQYVFQEWFLGSELCPKYWSGKVSQLGKPGLTYGEEPIVDKDKLLTLFSLISQSKRLGIGTGRPCVEAITPLTRWGAIDYIDKETIITYQDVHKAQNALQKTQPGLSLTKPHPYVFLRGVFQNTLSDEDLIFGNYNKNLCRKTLVIGDALCDLFAAKAAGCDFATVLTGIDGESARSYFEAEKADYILHNILDLLES